MNVNIDIIVYICTAITTIAAAGVILRKILLNTIKKASNEIFDQTTNKLHDNLNSQIEELKKMLDEYTTENKKDISILKEAQLSQIRDRINQAHTAYVQKGVIGAYTLSTLTDLYDSYKKLGGNSFIEEEMRDIKSLRIVTAEELQEINNKEGHN